MDGTRTEARGLFDGLRHVLGGPCWSLFVEWPRGFEATKGAIIIAKLDTTAAPAGSARAASFAGLSQSACCVPSFGCVAQVCLYSREICRVVIGKRPTDEKGTLTICRSHLFLSHQLQSFRPVQAQLWGPVDSATGAPGSLLARYLTSLRKTLSELEDLSLRPVLKEVCPRDLLVWGEGVA